MVKDRIAGIVLLLFCGFFYYQSTLVDVKDLTKISAVFFPRLILGLIALLAVVLLIQSFLKKEVQAKKETEANKGKKGIVWIIFALFGLYVISLELLGFIVASFLFITVTYFLILPEKKPIKTHVFALSGLLVVTIALSLVFEKLLYVFLPQGIFF
ncbi:hypothetical protein GCM10008967_17350 [Bacillus carboniphilus]|uniref:DUF1468 domain-containing protein n=1 Tax=Bacillus carboniphilus TaxID=86663 RepID=A0ABP3FVG7_9BACI